MNIKFELIQGHITELIKKVFEENIIDSSIIADTNAIMILDKITEILRNETLTDFDAIEEIVCVLEKNNIDCGGRHDF